MLKINQIKYIPVSEKKSLKPVCENISAVNNTEFSKTANDCILNMHKGLMNVRKPVPRLDKLSEECTFFGADSAYNVQKEIEHQVALSLFKSKEQNLVNFPCLDITSQKDITGDGKEIKECIKNLKENGLGRWTAFNINFGPKEEAGTHTVGLVHDKNTVWVIDSLSEENQGVKKYHQIFKNILGKEYNKVKFVDSGQQSFDEYTCNNWTHANIDAVKKYRVTNDKLDEMVLSEILPTDINQILKEQKEYVTQKLNGRSLYDIIAEEKYSKR